MNPGPWNIYESVTDALWVGGGDRVVYISRISDPLAGHVMATQPSMLEMTAIKSDPHSPHFNSAQLLADLYSVVHGVRELATKSGARAASLNSIEFRASNQFGH